MPYTLNTTRSEKRLPRSTPMHCRRILQSIFILSCSIFMLPVIANTTVDSTDSSAEQHEGSHLVNCEDPVNSARQEIKDAVGPLYANGAAQSELELVANRIDKFITSATYCRMTLQSASQRAKPETIGEWISLQQWLNRLADTFARSASDSEYTNWKDEYTLFAEIYEFEP